MKNAANSLRKNNTNFNLEKQENLPRKEYKQW